MRMGILLLDRTVGLFPLVMTLVRYQTGCVWALLSGGALNVCCSFRILSKLGGVWKGGIFQPLSNKAC